MTDLYTYCTKCGDELTEHERDIARESDGPPICVTCYTELMYGMAEPLARMYAQMLESIREAFEPLIEALDTDD